MNPMAEPASDPPDRTPAELGYRWPAEWETHAATWLAWPHHRETWPGRFDLIPQRFAELIALIAAYEPVHILAGHASVMDAAQSAVGHLANVSLHDIPTNDAWVRDYGPTFLVPSGRRMAALVNWQYDAWGKKYPPWNLDDQAARRVAQTLNVLPFDAPVVLEGGAIDTDGQGRILTTESCLLDPTRNPSINKSIMERVLLEFLSATDVIWLTGQPLAGDDTDGHIDQQARFVAPGTVVAASTDDTSDPNYHALRRNLAELRTMTLGDGSPLEVVLLPMPKPIAIDGRAVPASYCNFYVANQCVIVPTFDDPADDIACGILARRFPSREVLGFPARELIWGLGAVHCLTQQQPSLRKESRRSLES